MFGLALLVLASSRGLADDGVQEPPPIGPAGESTSEPRDSGPAAPAPPSPLYIWLDSASDLATLLQRLRQPDVVVLDGSRYRELLDRLEPRGAEGSEGGAIVKSVEVVATLQDELVDVRVEYAIELIEDGEQRVSIGLDGRILASVREGVRDLSPISLQGGAWAVGLSGKGVHRVVATLNLPPESTPEGPHLELAIPEVATTSLQFRSDAPLSEASLDGHGPLVLESDLATGGTSVSVILTPRSKLSLSWRPVSALPPEGPAVLTAQGSISVDVEPGLARISTVYDIRSERGTARNLTFRLDPADELIALELNDRPIVTETTRSDPDSPLTVALPEPIAVGATAKLTITTRRALPIGKPSDLRFRGFPLAEVAVQSGLIAVSQTGEVSVTATSGRGLRQVDPRTELPPSLRVRPSNVLAYQFFDQPFDLDLQVDPSPVWVSVESRSSVSLSSRTARVETWFDYRVARGRVFEVRIEVPEGLRLEVVGPDRYVNPRDDPLPRQASEQAGARILTLRLTPEAREDGAFRVHLVGLQPITPTGRLEVPLFRPVGTTLRRGIAEVSSTRDLTVEAIEGQHARPASSESLPELSSATDHPVGTAPPQWFEYDGEATALPMMVRAHSRSVRHRTRLEALVDRRALEVRQETECEVRFGSLSHLDVSVPEAVGSSWEYENPEVTRREDLGPGPGGVRRYRLFLSGPVSDRIVLGFRLRVRLVPPLEPDRDRSLEIPSVRILEGEAMPATIEVSADLAIRLSASGSGWTEVEERRPTAASRDDPPVRLVRSAPGDEASLVVARSAALIAMPPLVASRLWLSTTETADGGMRVTARYRIERHPGAIAVALPAGAEWDQVRVGPAPVAELEELPETGGYRFQMPRSASAAPVTVTLDYNIPASQAGRPWGAPRLLGGGLVLQTFWEARLIEGRVLVGVPAGWSDENEWAWDMLGGRRGSRVSRSALAAWVEDARPPERPDAPQEIGRDYLFSRSGEPGTLAPLVVSRAVLVGWFSGGLLALGLIVLLGVVPGRPVALVALACVLMAASAAHPSVVLLVLQSSSIGALLLIPAAVTHRLVERRRGSGSIMADSGEPSVRLGSSTQGRPPSSSDDLASEVGSEESTVIRSRQEAPVEHVGVNSPRTVRGGGSDARVL